MSRLETRVRMRGTRPKTIYNRWIARIQGQLTWLVGLRLARNTRARVRTTKRSPDGSRWPKRKDKHPHPLLVRSEDMLKSIKARRIERGAVAVNAEVDYAKFQNAARRFLGVSTVDVRDVEDNVIDPWVRKNLR